MKAKPKTTTKTNARKLTAAQMKKIAGGAGPAKMSKAISKRW